MPTPTSAAKNAKLGRINRSASCGGENGKALAITSVAHWQTNSMLARSFRQRRSVATIPMPPNKSIIGETVIAVQTSVLYQGSGIIEIVHPPKKLRGDVEPRLSPAMQIQIEKRAQPRDRRIPQRRIQCDKYDQSNRQPDGQGTQAARVAVQGRPSHEAAEVPANR